jgi:MFS family permease
MPPLVTFLLSKFDWRTVSLIMAAIGILAMPIIWLFIKNPPKAVALAVEGEIDSIPIARTAGGREWTTREILRNRNFWAMVLSSLPVCTAFQGVGANFSLLMSDVGIAAQTAAFLLSFIGIFSIIGKPIVGRLSDRYDHRMLILLGSIITGSGYLLLLLGNHPGYIRLVLGSVLTSAASAFFFPMQGAIIGRYFGIQSFGRIIGLLNLFYLFGALGPPIAGLVRDKLGSYHFFIIGVAAVPVLMASFIFWLKPRTA